MPAKCKNSGLFFNTPRTGGKKLEDFSIQFEHIIKIRVGRNEWSVFYGFTSICLYSTLSNASESHVFVTRNQIEKKTSFA